MLSCLLHGVSHRGLRTALAGYVLMHTTIAIRHAPAAESVSTALHDAVRAATAYLAAESDDDRDQLGKQLEAYSGSIDLVLQHLSQHQHGPVEPGYHADEKFQVATLRKRYPDDWLYFVVPKSYDPAKPTGLIIFMHGGGIGTSRDAAKHTLRFPLSDSPADTYRSGDMFEATGMITVGPSAPGKHESYYRWCLRDSESYLAAVIEECKSRFNIDSHRVFLLGHSMGGFGAFHHALRQPDRFAAIISCAGAWDCGYWPAMRGTPFCMVQAVNDAESGVRGHNTDIEYGRLSHHLFTRASLDHTYYEYEGGHNFGGMRPYVARYFAEKKDLRRDPYYPHVTLASPQGFAWGYLNPVRHNRWLSLDKSSGGTIEFDELAEEGDDFDSWQLDHELTKRRGAVIDANIRAGNRIQVTTQNVARFTIWLHPRMIDVAQPVIVDVDGQARFKGLVRPSLQTALDSYRRRADWGLIYPMKIELDIDD